MIVRCRCENELEIDARDSLDLDREPGALASLLDGSYLSASCPRCGAVMRPEFAVRVRWATKGLDAQVLPELDRLAVYRGKGDAPAGLEILVGYPELFERARILGDGLDAKSVEVLKYFLYEKASNDAPDAELEVRYACLAGEALEFHIAGLKEGQTAVAKLPKAAYDKAVRGFKDSVSKPPLAEVFTGPYRSIKKLSYLELEAEG